MEEVKQKRPRGRPRKNPLNADEILQSLQAKKKPAVLARDSQPSARQTQNSDDETSQTPHFNSIPDESISFPRTKQVSGNQSGKSNNDNNKTNKLTKTTKTSPSKDKKSNQNDKKEEINLVDDEPSDDEIIRHSMAPMEEDDTHLEWIGEPLGSIGNKKYYRKCKKDQTEFKLFDFVIVDQIHYSPPFFGQILLLWQDTSPHILSDPLVRTYDKKMLCKWYYRPEDTKTGKKPLYGDQEVFASNMITEHFIFCIQSRCKIETYQQYRARADFPHDVFFFREVYEPLSGQFSPITPNDDPSPSGLRNCLPKEYLDIMIKLKLLEPPKGYTLQTSKESPPSSLSQKPVTAGQKSPKRKRVVVDDDDEEEVSGKSHSETENKTNGKSEPKKTSTSIQLFNEGLDEDTKGSLDLDLSQTEEAPVRKRLKKPEPETNSKSNNNNSSSNKKALNNSSELDLDLAPTTKPTILQSITDKTSLKPTTTKAPTTKPTAAQTVLAYDSQEDSDPKDNPNTRKSPRITLAAKKKEEIKQQHAENLKNINRQLFSNNEQEEDQDKSEAEEIVPDTNNNNFMEEDAPTTTITGSQPKYPSSKFAKSTSGGSQKPSSSKTMIDLAESDHEDKPSSHASTSHSAVDTPSKSSSGSKILKAQDFSFDDDERQKSSLGGTRKPLALHLGGSKIAATQSRLTELFKLGQPSPTNFFSSAVKVPKDQTPPRKSLEFVSSPTSSAASFNQQKKKIFLSNYEESNQWDDKKQDADLGVIEPVSFSMSEFNNLSYTSSIGNQNRLGATQRTGLAQSSVNSLLTQSNNNNSNTQKKGLQLKPKTIVNLEDESDEPVKSPPPKSPPKSKYSYSLSSPPSVDDIEVDEDDIQREKKQKELEERLKAASSSSSRKQRKKHVHSNGSFIPELFVTNNPQEASSDQEREHMKAQQRLHRHKPTNSDFDDQPATRRYATKKSNRPLDKEYESERSQESEEDSDLDGFIVHDTADPTMNSLDEALRDTSPSIGGKRKIQDEDEEEEIISVIQKDKVRKPASPEPTLDDYAGDFSLKSAFGVYVQYVISCNLDETFPESIRSTRNENYFTPAIKKVEGSLESRKELMLRSTAWHKQFQDDLECYPQYSSFQSTRQNHRDCEACLRTAHHASWEVRLSGTKYDAKKVWQGLVLPPAVDEGHDGSRDYVLGKFCHARTELFHQMHHYKIHLFHRVEKKLESVNSDLTADEVVEKLLSDDPWLDELYDDFRKLIQNADDFGRDGMTET